MHFVHYGNQPYCIIISDNQPYCIICNCSFSHYGLHIVSLIYFQHISFFQSVQAEQSWVEPSTFSSPLCLFFSQVSLVGFLFCWASTSRPWPPAWAACTVHPGSSSVSPRRESSRLLDFLGKGWVLVGRFSKQGKQDCVILCLTK